MELLFSPSTALIALFAAVCILGSLHLWRDRMPAARRVALGVLLVLIVLGFFGALCWTIAAGGTF